MPFVRLFGSVLAVALTAGSFAQELAGAGPGGPIVLNPDDVPAFPEPPAGIDKKRDDVPHGKLEMVSYESKTVGTARKMNVYTPPGYSHGQEIPGALPAARHRRRRDGVGAVRPTRTFCSTT